MTAKLSGDHLRILKLAKSAIAAETGPGWKSDICAAVEHHGAACDALWEELRRQVGTAGAALPESRPEGKSQKDVARQVRSEIITACRTAVDAVLSEMIDEGRLE